MKKVITTIIAIAIIALFVYVGYFLWQKNQEEPVVYETSSPYYTDIIKKTVATGSINPRKEIDLKPQISGILDEILVEAGELVNKGQLIAKIKVIPDDISLNSAESNVNKARIALEESEIEKNRREALYNAKVISESEYNQFLFSYQQRIEDLEAAENNLQLIKKGVSKKHKQSTTMVSATISGMVLDVPVKEGEQVIESNNFNNGTTIAIVADMSDLIFEGYVDESEVGKISEGMNLNITVGAIEGQTYNADLEYISPKGTDDEGTIQFEIRAALKSNEISNIRAGYSANADIILERKDSVLSVQERDLVFEDEDIFVEVETGDQEFEKQLLEVGISDGINIEVISGLNEDHKVKTQK